VSEFFYRTNKVLAFCAKENPVDFARVSVVADAAARSHAAPSLALGRRWVEVMAAEGWTVERTRDRVVAGIDTPRGE
jgi:hypothetical protein